MLISDRFPKPEIEITLQMVLGLHAHGESFFLGIEGSQAIGFSVIADGGLPAVAVCIHAAAAAPTLFIARTAATFCLTASEGIGGMQAFLAAIALAAPDDGIAAALLRGLNGHQLAKAHAGNIAKAGTLACVRHAAAAFGVAADQRTGNDLRFTTAITLAAPEVTAEALFARALNGRQHSEALTGNILGAPLASAAATGTGLIHGERMIAHIFDFAAIADAFPDTFAVFSGNTSKRHQLAETLAGDIKTIDF